MSCPGCGRDKLILDTPRSNGYCRECDEILYPEEYDKELDRTTWEVRRAYAERLGTGCPYLVDNWALINMKCEIGPAIGHIAGILRADFQ